METCYPVIIPYIQAAKEEEYIVFKRHVVKLLQPGQIERDRQERVKSTTLQPLCRNMFLFIIYISRKRLQIVE